MKPATTSTEVLGRVVASYRKAKSASQAEFGEALGLSQSAYSRLERGDTWVTFPQLGELAESCGVTASDLVGAVECAAATLSNQGVTMIWASHGLPSDRLWITASVIDDAVKAALDRDSPKKSKKK